MMNSKNIFTEIQDPKVLTRLRNSFFVLFVTGVLVAFVVSKDFRHFVTGPIGIGDNHPVQVAKSPPTKKAPREKGLKGGKTQGFVQKDSSASPAKGREQGTQLESNQKDSTGSGNPDSNNPGGNGDPIIQPSPPTPVAPSTPGQETISSPRGPTVTPPAPPKPKVPPVVVIPTSDIEGTVEETVDAVNDTVNGVTGVVDEVTQDLPVQTNIPKVCLVQPC